MDYIYEGSINIPIKYYYTALAIGIISLVITYFIKRTAALPISILLSYIFLVFASTVISRVTQLDYDYNLKLFWSYEEIRNGREDLIYENLFNVIMFMPIGFLVQAIKRLKPWQVFAFGFVISSTIELLQLSLKKGFFEYDDMVHNTLGCIIGYIICCALQVIISHIKEKMK